MALFSNILYLFNGIDIDNLIQENNSIKEELSSIKKDLLKYSISLKEKNSEISQIRKLNKSYKGDLDKEINKSSKLKIEIDNLLTKNAELNNRNEILTNSEQKQKDKNEEISKANTALNEKNYVLSSEVKKLNERIFKLEAQRTEQQSYLSETLAEMSMMKTDLDNLKSEYDSKNEKIEKAQKTIEIEKAEKEKAEKDYTRLLENYHIISEKYGSLQITVKELRNETNRITANFEKTKEKINLLNEENSNKEKERNTLLERFKKQEEENEYLRQQIQGLVAEKEELSPYMYLVEAKKEQEAIESAIKEARNDLQDSLDSATSILLTIKHEEIKNSLENAIKTSQETVNSFDCTLEELKESKETIDSTSKEAIEKEKNLIEHEEIERKHREEEEEKKRQEEENWHKEQEMKNDLERLVGVAKSFCNTISNDDISMPLQTAIDDTDIFIKAGLFDLHTLDAKHTILKNALDEAKKEIENTKRAESHVVKRSILEIFDTKEGNIIDSESFFKRPEHELIRWRRIFEESILTREHRFICTNCRQDVKISGRKYYRGQVSFFSHLHDSDYCEMKTTTGLSKEQIEARKYGLVAESDRHKKLKTLIYNALGGHISLNKGVTDVAAEKRVNSDLPYMNWRRPDVMAKYKDIKIVFELQLSTTFISVIVQRDIFYRLNDYFIIWVFNFDDNPKYVDLTNLMCKDIYYANKRNVFIFAKDNQKTCISLIISIVVWEL